MELTQLALALAIGYGLGSIPFGLILTRVAGTADIRSIGSGNIGATNVLRTGRKDLAAATLLLDGVKGSIAVLIGVVLGGDDAGLAGGVGAFLGHVFPLWLGFRGGKGVATFLGGLLAAAWPAGLAFAVVWLAVAAASRYSSAAALAASLATPLVLAATGRSHAAVVFAAMAFLLWVMHRANLGRLVAGTEGRIGKKA